MKNISKFIAIEIIIYLNNLSDWLGGGSFGGPGIQNGHESLFLEDTVNDVMIVLTDGFLQDIEAVTQV